MANEDYAVGAAKQDPSTGFLAQKTGPNVWRVFRPDGNSHFVEYADIYAWVDLKAGM